MNNTERQRILTVESLLRRAHAAFSENTEVANGVCISLLHDAVEHSLYLAIMRHHTPISNRPDFKELTKAVAEAFQQVTSEEMLYRTPLDTLNKIRVTFKHSGVIPARAATIEAMESGRAFLSYFFERLFAIDINNFDLSDVIRIEEIKKYVKQARDELSKNKPTEATNACAEANYLFISALRFLFRPPNAPRVPIQTGEHRNDRYATEIAQKLLQHALDNDMTTLSFSLMLSSGIDPFEHAKFNLSLPAVSKYGDGRSQYVYNHSWPGSSADVPFLIKHVTRITLWLEERFPTLGYTDQNWHL